MSKTSDMDSKGGVFISYNRKYSSSAARAVYQALKAKGFDTYFDVEDINPGRFTEVILNQIGLRDHFVIILTPDSVNILRETSSWTRRETERALELEKNVVPILLEGVSPITTTEQDSLFQKIAALNQLEVPHQYFDAAMDKLCSDLLQQPTLQELKFKIAEEYYAKAEEAFQNEQWKAVIEEISQAIQRAPNRPDYYLMRSVARHRIDDNIQSIQDIDAAIALDPEAFDLAEAKFNILQNMDRVQEALEFITRWQKSNKHEESYDYDGLY